MISYYLQILQVVPIIFHATVYMYIVYCMHTREQPIFLIYVGTHWAISVSYLWYISKSMQAYQRLHTCYSLPYPTSPHPLSNTIWDLTLTFGFIIYQNSAWVILFPSLICSYLLIFCASVYFMYTHCKLSLPQSILPSWLKKPSCRWKFSGRPESPGRSAGWSWWWC